MAGLVSLSSWLAVPSVPAPSGRVSQDTLISVVESQARLADLCASALKHVQAGRAFESWKDLFVGFSAGWFAGAVSALVWILRHGTGFANASARIEYVVDPARRDAVLRSLGDAPVTSPVAPPDLMAGGRAVLRGASALIQEDLNDEDSWTYVQWVREQDKGSWLEEKRAGAGRDPRLNQTQGDAPGVRLLWANAAPTMTRVELPGWPFKGPSATKEVLESLRGSGMEPPGYLAHYLTASGVSPTSGVAVELKVLVTMLWLMVCYDKLGATNLSMAEHLCRRLLAIQRAIRRNARSPGFSGLEVFLVTNLDAMGSIQTLDFERYIAEVQKSEAQVMNIQRLAVEESEASDKRRKQQKPGPTPGASS